MFVRSAVVFAVFMASAALAAPSRAADADILREARDRAEIQDLMWRYCRALDTLDADAYAAVFTEDGQFGAGATPSRGRAALRKVITDVLAARAERTAKGEPPSPPMYHVITNANIEFVDADHAIHHSYWMTVFGGAGQETPPRVAAAGRSVDELVRVDGNWLIRTRNVRPDN